MQDKVMLKIVKEAIESVLYKRSVDKGLYLSLYPELKQKSAVFVTINKRDSLRGCIGSLVAHRTLFDDLVENAISAGFKDPRFAPLSMQEYESGDLSIEVSVLSEPKPLVYSDVEELKSKIRVGVDGVILTLDGHRATFLPQVWEQLPEFELFFSHLCQKAGLEGECIQRHPNIEVYEVKKIR